ncbi:MULTISPECIES: alpha/beta hydrolase [unclassified Streptomyces]|uniref:alpha/beta hydrolase n=1 Tax=unclassified Streptomyces TaxID=2593676 RepID=UPI002E2CFDC0|nr:alpha/beta hydrolase [Streptomyces sp. NBC_00223]
MTDVGELKQFGLVHTKTQGIPPDEFERISALITNDEDGADGSWAAEWNRAAGAIDLQGHPELAYRYYAMARFPYIDGPTRRYALHQCVADFGAAHAGQGFERLDLEIGGGRVGCWAVGLSATEPKPLLVVTGGIVAAKEQYAPMMALATSLGMAGLVTEMPGVGENTLSYDAKSWELFPALLDAVGDRADVEHTYAMALSFSGHLALRAATHDRRIKGIVAAAAPVSDFYTDDDWHRRLPRITADTLAHLTDTELPELADHMRDWALTPAELASLTIPVYCMGSDGDEIIPPGEIGHLRRHVRDLHVLSYRDAHAAPRHVTETQTWLLHSVLTMRGGSPRERLRLGAKLRYLRWRRLIGQWRGK